MSEKTWKWYNFFFPEYPRMMIFLVFAAATLHFFRPDMQPHPLFRNWLIVPDRTALWLTALYVGLLSVEVFGIARAKQIEASRIDAIPLPAMLYVGAREEPVYNWLMIYVIAGFLRILDSYVPVHLVFEAMLSGNGLPLVGIDRSLWWAVVGGAIVTELYFGSRHVEWRNTELTLSQKLEHAAIITIKGFVLAILSYYDGIIVAMIFHSLYDVALKLVRLRKLRQQAVG